MGAGNEVDTGDPQLQRVIADIRSQRLYRWPSRWRCWFLKLALGRKTFEYMLRSIKQDSRTPSAHEVDIVVRQDGLERRIEADWIKIIARYAYRLEEPELLKKWRSGNAR